AFVGINLVVALLELDVALGNTKARPPTVVALLALPVMLFGGYLVGTDAVVLGLCAGLAGGFVHIMVTHQRGHTVSRMAALTLMLLWVNLLASSLGLLLSREDGFWFVLAPTALTITNDVGAYAFGRNFGRTHMAPAISPRKSWEGFVGALAVTVVVAVLVTARVVPGVTIPIAIVLGVAVVAAATLGDLSESLMKRDLGVKDLGTIFPGHGGVMDRIDALLFALPTAHVVFLAFGL
ncbi:MAG TPA: phosphatidate cytidylyltransferase, partial [Euzebya sp.]|nr:phosphatidate cytidylyltransferase [Euzebya sp.]